MSNIIVNCQQIIRFSDTRKPSQAKQLFVSWLQYGQEIPISEPTIFNPHYRASQWITNKALV